MGKEIAETIKVSWDEQEKQWVRDFNKGALSEIGTALYPTRNDKSMFIIMLVQYLGALDSGITLYRGGHVDRGDYDKLSAFAGSTEMFNYISEIVQLRNDIATGGGLEYVFNDLEDIWNRPEMKTLCDRFGIKFGNTGVSAFDAAKIMSGEQSK